MEKLNLVAFDIGKKNFAFCMIEYSMDDINELIQLKSNTAELYDNLYKNGKVILFSNNDLTFDCNNKKYLDPKVFINMTDKLDEYKSYWDNVDVILIEQQMAFRGKRNTMALKLGQHCYSYFCINYRNSKSIIEFPAYHKTQVLNAPKKFGKIEKVYKNGKTKMINDNLKKWSIRTCTEILEKKNDEDTLEILNKLRKKDDVSDCLLMTKSYILLKYIYKKNIYKK